MTYSQSQRVRILYKTILKLHRGLPEELQVLGTNYTRDEFRRHKKCNEKEAGIFINEWTVSYVYLKNIYFSNNVFFCLELCFNFSKTVRNSRT